MQRTMWSPISITNAWAWFHRSLESGMTMSRDSWMERVCIQYSNMSSCIIVYCSVIFLFTCCASGVWILVRPRERLVDEETDLRKSPFHVLWRYCWGNLLIVRVALVVLAWFLSVCWLCTRLLWRVTTIFPMCFQDTRREINKLCSFLGLSPSPEKMEMIIDKVKFENMKTNDMVNNKSFQGLNFKVSSFMRKGTVDSNTVYNVSSYNSVSASKRLKYVMQLICREGRWLEEPFHLGPEWRVWRRLQEKNGKFYSAIPLYTLKTWNNCAENKRLRG